MSLLQSRSSSGKVDDERALRLGSDRWYSGVGIPVSCDVMVPAQSDPTSSLKPNRQRGNAHAPVGILPIVLSFRCDQQ